MGVAVSENIELKIGFAFGTASDSIVMAEEILSQIEFCPVKMTTDWSEPPDSMKGAW